MLVISRKLDEQIKIGDDVTLTVIGISGGRVKLGIAAPLEKRIMRSELSPVRAAGLRAPGLRSHVTEAINRRVKQTRGEP